MTEPFTQLALGIHFGVPEKIYRRDPALSRSDLVNLLDSPRTYYDKSPMNPARKDDSGKQKDYMLFGEAFHTALFEPEKFKERYNVLVSGQFNDGTGPTKILTIEQFERIRDAVTVIREGEDSSLFLSGGYGEVVIIFQYAGLRFKTRHDYFTIASTTDFKTTHTLHEGVIKREFEKFGYDIQLALYKLSRRELKKELAKPAGQSQYRIYGSAHAGEKRKEFMRKFVEEPIDEFTFIMQRTTAPYPYEALLPDDQTENIGMGRIAQACAIYQYNMHTYGPTKPWPACDGKIKEFSMIYGIKR